MKQENIHNQPTEINPELTQMLEFEDKCVQLSCCSNCIPYAKKFREMLDMRKTQVKFLNIETMIFKIKKCMDLKITIASIQYETQKENIAKKKK